MQKAFLQEEDKEKDENEIFGMLVTAELRKLSPRSQRVARHQIQNLLFNLQMNQDELPGNSAMFMPHSVSYNQAAAFYPSFPHSPIASSTPMPLKRLCS